MYIKNGLDSYQKLIQFLKQQYHLMEAQSQKHTLITNSCSDQELKQLIINSYKGRCNQDVKEAELTLVRAIDHQGFLQRLITIMISQKQADQNFRKAIANLIKKFSFEYAQKPCDKSQFIETIFQLILSERLQVKVKQLLGIALQHQFNADKDEIYKKIVQERTLLMMCSQHCLQYFDSLMIIVTAYMNSIVEVEDQIEYFLLSIQPICLASLKLLQYVTNMPFEEWLIHDKLIFHKIVKLFQYLETILERILDQEKYYQNDIDKIRKNQFVISLLQQYLLLFNTNHSIVSEAYPRINETKNIMLNIVSMLYKHSTCPIKMFHIIFLTFISEAKVVVNDPAVESILVHCTALLTSHLERKIYITMFIEHKMQTIFSLFMYSVTNQEEYDWIESEPQKFVQLAEEYTETVPKSPYLKVRAAIMLQILTDKIDEAPKHILEIIMMIMTGSLQSQEQQSQTMMAIKAEFSKFNFYGLSPEQKLETSFMVLSVISPYINRRPDMNKVVYAFFLTQFELLVKITSPIVILRMMRVISYYPCALYFLYIETQMSRGKVFIIEGIKSLQRILRTNKFVQLFQFLATIFSKLLGVIQITDPVMQLIIINNYDKMLKNSPDLYGLCRNKIKQQFFLNVDKHQHATTICFNLLFSLIKKQTNENTMFLVEKEFYQITDYLITNNINAYNRYEDKLLEIYILIMNKHLSLRPQIQSFAQRSLKFLAKQEKGTFFFKFYNIYILKLDGAVFKLQPYFRAFKQQLKRRYLLFIEANEPIDSIAYFCFLMSEIIGNSCHIELTDNDLQDLLSIATKVSEQNKQYPLIVFLTYLYVKPFPTVQFLKNHNLYEGFLSEIVKIKFQGKILIKIFTLSLVKLLQIQQDPIFIKKILSECINTLKHQYKQSSTKMQAKINYEIRPRRFGQQKAVLQQCMEEQDKNDNQLINLFVNYKHPFSNLSEYDQFKVIFWQNDQLANQLSEEQKKDLRLILETEWIQNKTRTIRRVKKM